MIETLIGSTGIFSSLRRLLDTSLAMVQNRLELFALELREEEGRLLSVLIWGAMLIFLCFMTLVAVMITVVFLLWDHRLAVMGGFTGLFLIGLIVAAIVLKGKLSAPIPFSETLDQIKKDRKWLQGEK